MHVFIYYTISINIYVYKSIQFCISLKIIFSASVVNVENYIKFNKKKVKNHIVAKLKSYSKY